MFKRTRHTLRAGRDSRRSTLRQQRGGAAWVTVDVSRNAIWTEIFEKVDPTKQKFRSFLGEPADDAKRVHDYLYAIQHQDELLNGVIEHIFKKLGIQDDDKKYMTLIDKYKEVKAMKDEIMQLIIDVNQFITFKREEHAKIETLKKTDAIILALYPKRLTNIFIESLASIFIQLKQSPELLSNQTIKTTPALTNMLAAHFEGFAHEYSYHFTGINTIDGFYRDQEVKNFNTVLKGFYTKFISLVMSDTETLFDKRPSYTKANEGCKDFFYYTEESMAHICYSLFKKYMENKLTAKELVADFKLTTDVSQCKTFYITDQFTPSNTIGKGIIDKYGPPPSSFKIPILGTETTLDMVFHQTQIYIMEFMLHLTYTIERIEKSMTPAPTSSPENKGPATGIEQ